MVDGGSAADLDVPDSYAALEAQLIEHEGLKLFPYLDTVNKLTIGAGRNLTDKGITRAEALYLLRNDILEARLALDRHLPWWRGLGLIRRRVLIDMAFGLGIHGLMGFEKTLAMIQGGRYSDAADEMMDSLWAKQVGRRAKRLAKMMADNTEVLLSEVE